jgi:hypothetical protein
MLNSGQLRPIKTAPPTMSATVTLAHVGGELRGAPTPRIDQRPAKDRGSPSSWSSRPARHPRAAPMTGQYSIRSALSLIAIEGSPYTPPWFPAEDDRPFLLQFRFLATRDPL